MEIIIRDGSTNLVAANRIGEAVAVTPNIPIEVVVDATCTPGAYTHFQMLLRQADDPAGPWETLLSSPMFLTHNQPLTWSAIATPTKPYLRDRWAINATGTPGLLTVIANYEVMAEAVYNRLMRAKRVTEKQIEACDDQVAEHALAATEAADKKAVLELESALWGNFLSDELTQYELVNPPA